jgi:hypothetical protein
LGYLYDILINSQVEIQETGCTNRFHLHDVEKAATKGATLFISYYSEVTDFGFIRRPDICELSALCKSKALTLIAANWSGKWCESAKCIACGAEVVIFPLYLQRGNVPENNADRNNEILSLVATGSGKLLSRIELKLEESKGAANRILINKAKDLFYRGLKNSDNKQ